MKTLLVLAVIAAASIANAAGKLSVSVIPSQGGASYLDFTEANGLITSVGEGPFSGANHVVYVEEKADGSLQGFVMGVPFNLVCSATACTDRGATAVNVKLGTKKDGAATYDGMIRYHFVHGTISDSKISVISDASFEAKKSKSGAYVGSGAFSRAPVGLEARVSAEGSLSLNDPRVVVLLLLNTFTAR